mmetsp:Transcript_7803/g.22364  ORF Transcript_7803/g.22364 Transcript_7803/m.22364 type:complete len:244 (-) Transcript_7803:1129-1860(-)
MQVEWPERSFRALTTFVGDARDGRRSVCAGQWCRWQSASCLEATTAAACGRSRSLARGLRQRRRLKNLVLDVTDLAVECVRDIGLRRWRSRCIAREAVGYACSTTLVARVAQQGHCPLQNSQISFDGRNLVPHTAKASRHQVHVQLLDLRHGASEVHPEALRNLAQVVARALHLSFECSLEICDFAADITAHHLQVLAHCFFHGLDAIAEGPRAGASHSASAAAPHNEALAGVGHPGARNADG